MPTTLTTKHNNTSEVLNVPNVLAPPKHKKTYIFNLKNQTFGLLTALAPTNERKHGSVVWKCICNCVNKSIVYCSAEQLKRTTAHNLHCGCKEEETVKLEAGVIANITNQTFGYLTALRPTNKRTSGAVMWECKCKCGNLTYRSVGNLKTGNENQSCGCLLSSISKQASQKKLNLVDGTCIEKISNQTLLTTNTSGIRGVHWDRNANKWRAIIYFRGKQIHLGLFNDIEDAAKARKAAEDLYFKPVIERYGGGRVVGV